jgi:hypothetical protein
MSVCNLDFGYGRKEHSDASASVVYAHPGISAGRKILLLLFRDIYGKVINTWLYIRHNSQNHALHIFSPSE